MRYRPVGQSGMVVSAVSLLLATSRERPRAADWASLVNAALESGINTFEAVDADPAIVDGLAQALAGVDRRLVFVVWRLGPMHATGGLRRDFSADGLSRQIQAALARTGLGYLDAVILDDPGPHELLPETFAALNHQKEQGCIQLIGVCGMDDVLDEHVATGEFDLLAAPFNLTSPWKDRNRMRTAGEQNMTVFGRQPYPRDFHKAVTAARAESPRDRGRLEALAGRGSYEFLDTTRGWTAEEICISYALTEPSLATVQIPAPRISELEAIAAVPEREMPPGLAAQIEMARFAPEAALGGQRTA